MLYLTVVVRRNLIPFCCLDFQLKPMMFYTHIEGSASAA